MTTNLFNWREMPFVRLFIPLALGIIVAEFWQPATPTLANAILSLSAVCMIFFILKKTQFQWRWVFGIPLSIFLFLVGFQSVFYHNELHYATHFKNSLNDEEDKFIVGIVTDRVEKKTNFRLTVTLQKMGDNADSLHAVSGNLLLYLKKDTLTEQTPPQSRQNRDFVPQYGDMILAAVKPREVEPPKNPDAFDFKAYLHHQNIHFQSFIQNDDVEILAQHKGNPILQTISNWQTHLLNILKVHLTTEREFAVGSALILGYRDAVTDEVKDAYVGTGSMHILAVSGMHILLIFNAFDWIIGFYKTGSRRWRWTKAGISIVLIWAFTLLTGAGASVLRAAVMSTFMALSKGWGRKVSIYNVLAASAFVLLSWNPFWLFDVGFQLSYFAVIGIVYGQPKIRKLLIFKNKIANWAWEATAVGLAAQLVVTPISLYYFHQFPTYFWLSGLLAVPVSSGALYAGIALFFTSWIPYLSSIIGKILFCCVWLMNEIVFGIQKLPLSIVTGFWLSAIGVFMIYLILIGTGFALKTRRLRALIYPLSIATVLSLLYAFSDIETTRQHEIIVYHSYKNSVVDFIDGKKCYSFSEKFSETSDTFNKIKFATENHRVRLKINTLETFDFYVSEKKSNFIYHNGVSQFQGHRMAILDNLPEKGVLLQVNTVLIHQNARFNISELLQYFKFDTLIFDGSNARWRVEKWKTECHNLGIVYHDTAEKGAWVKKL
jgi:competence protein ComEC